MNEPRPSPTELPVSVLVLRCQAGDEAAFARLVEEFGPRVLGYLRGLVGEEAEDVHQEVWLAVYRRLGGLVNPGGFRTWLYQTARHRAIDILRRQRRAQELFVENAEMDAVAALEPSPEGMASVLAEEMLERLPPLQREVVLLRYRDGLSYAEMALIAGCSVGTVRSRLFYARQRLAQGAKGILPTEV